MIGFAPVESTMEKISQVMNEEIEVINGKARIRNSRKAHLENGVHYFTVMLDLEVSFSVTPEEPAINEAKISLLPEEILPFSTALREHAIPFPSNFSQQLVQKSSTSSIQLKSQEPAVQFAHRLASALQAISPRQ